MDYHLVSPMFPETWSENLWLNSKDYGGQNQSKNKIYELLVVLIGNWNNNNNNNNEFRLPIMILSWFSVQLESMPVQLFQPTSLGEFGAMYVVIWKITQIKYNYYFEKELTKRSLT